MLCVKLKGMFAGSSGSYTSQTGHVLDADWVVSKRYAKHWAFDLVIPPRTYAANNRLRVMVNTNAWRMISFRAMLCV